MLSKKNSNSLCGGMVKPLWGFTMLKVKRVNDTDYAIMFVIYDDEYQTEGWIARNEEGAIVGSGELKIAGREAGRLFVMSFAKKYTVRELRKAVRSYMDDEAKKIIEEYAAKVRA